MLTSPPTVHRPWMQSLLLINISIELSFPAQRDSRVFSRINLISLRLVVEIMLHQHDINYNILYCRELARKRRRIDWISEKVFFHASKHYGTCGLRSVGAKQTNRVWSKTRWKIGSSHKLINRSHGTNVLISLRGISSGARKEPEGQSAGCAQSFKPEWIVKDCKCS